MKCSGFVYGAKPESDSPPYKNLTDFLIAESRRPASPYAAAVGYRTSAAAHANVDPAPPCRTATWRRPIGRSTAGGNPPQSTTIGDAGLVNAGPMRPLHDRPPDNSAFRRTFRGFPPVSDRLPRHPRCLQAKAD